MVKVAQLPHHQALADMSKRTIKAIVPTAVILIFLLTAYIWHTGWFSPRVYLDQGLLLTMEDQARWLIRSKLRHQTQVPNDLDYIQTEALLKVNPKAVRLVLPGKETAE
jgi:hypothetical protein